MTDTPVAEPLADEAEPTERTPKQARLTDTPAVEPPDDEGEPTQRTPQQARIHNAKPSPCTAAQEESQRHVLCPFMKPAPIKHMEYALPCGIPMLNSEFMKQALWYEWIVLIEYPLNPSGENAIYYRKIMSQPMFRYCVSCQLTDFGDKFVSPLHADLHNPFVALIGRCSCVCCRRCVHKQEQKDGYVDCPNCGYRKAHLLNQPRCVLPEGESW